ncbi:hypothetical protein COV19_01980 [Candidatus Woesearchaeota archaeon CG10_big_fil_rev_8_21_14_0_10_44_13]|nr:MAG: hypothetical protein COV19_01980 [Candidatus Woesearchaeota archaeon CG10_big_fil_rev_8_21_14_0_10_44_13]
MEKIGLCLFKKGYTVKGLSKCCFDRIARKGSRILLIKVLLDANAISEDHAGQMKSLSRYMNASPLVIAEKAGQNLETNVVYSREGIYTLNFDTFRNCIDEKLPFVASTNAGLTATIIGEKIRQKKDELGLSLAQLSRKIGVSRRMIVKYGAEEAVSQITMSKAEKIYRVFGHDVFTKIDVFGRSAERNIENQENEQRAMLQAPITRKYSELGFEASETRKVPFNIIAKKDDELIITGVGDRINPDAGLLSRLIDADNLVIFDRKKPMERDIPAITKQEFMEFEEADELIKFLREF